MEEGVDDLVLLLERARGRDAEAYGEVVERFQDMAVGYGYSILGDFHLAQDAAQEAFLEAYVNLPGLREMEGFAGLLRRIVFKHCDRLTRRGRGCLILSTAAAVGRASLEAGPVQRLEEKEMKELVSQALESLPEQERAVVSLFYISDHSQNEIAGFLDISVDAVKNRLRAARKRLKERLIGMVEQNLSEGKPSKDRQFIEAVRRVMAPQQEKDAEAIYAWLEHKVQRLDMAVQSRKVRIADSHYDWTTSRLGLVDDELIAHVGVYEIGLWLGCGQVRVAGINVDYVDPDYSGGRELFDQVIEDAVGAMYTHGYDLSIVRVDSLDVYGPHGYVSTMPFAVRHRVKIEDLPTELPDVQLREVDLDDVHSYPGVAELYNRENEGVSMRGCDSAAPSHG